MMSGELLIFLLYWPLILPHHVPNEFLPISCYVSPISAGFQLTLFFQTGRAWPRIRPPPPAELFRGALDPGIGPFFIGHTPLVWIRGSPTSSTRHLKTVLFRGPYPSPPRRLAYILHALDIILTHYLRYYQGFDSFLPCSSLFALKLPVFCNYAT
jgi:hypothetical protein